MPFPAEGIFPSLFLYPAESGVEFAGFSKDFKLMLERYGRTLKNHRTNITFTAILNILKSTRCVGDDKKMNCGDAIIYTLPGLTYKIGDHISPIAGQGEWVIVTERYASRIGDLRIFRTLGLERYTPSAILEGLYDIADVANTELRSLYDILKELAQIIGLRAVPNQNGTISTYWNAEDDPDFSHYNVYRSTASGFTPSDVNLVAIAQTNYFRHSDLDESKIYYFRVCAVTKLDVPGTFSLEVSSVVYETTQEMLSRYDVNALDVPGIVLASKYDLAEEILPLDLISSYGITACDSLYPSSLLLPSTTLYPRGTGVSHAIMDIEFRSVYDIAETTLSLEMLSRYDVNALDVPGIVLASKYDLTEEIVPLEFASSYELITDLVSLEMLSRYDVNALDVPGIVLASKYDLTEEIVPLEFASSYDITKTPAQIIGERAVATGDMIDNYWNPWDDDDLMYYKVHRSLNNAFAPSDANLVGVPTTNAFKHINLAAATQYYFKVCAITKEGVSGTYSAQFTATTA